MGLYLRTIFVELCLDLADSSLLLLLWRTLSQGMAEAGVPATSAYREAGHRPSQYLALTDATELPTVASAVTLCVILDAITVASR